MTGTASITLEYHSASTAILTLDGSFARAARQELVSALAEAGECPGVLVDLSRVRHVDPSLVNALQQTAERLIGTPARLELVIPAGSFALQSLFQTVGAASIVRAHATRAEALEALARPASDRPGRRAA